MSPSARETAGATRDGHAGEPQSVGVLFDLDGVLTDTAELHFQSWLEIAARLGIPFDRARNEPLRGLSREESLNALLGPRAAELSDTQREDLLRDKNERFLARVDRMTPVDAAPGARGLLSELRLRGARVAVASSSRNARRVLERIALSDLLDAIVDGNDVARSKPAPDVFLVAAQRLGVQPSRCVVVEDAASGVAAALEARMRVLGIGPVERLDGATRVVARISDVAASDLLALADGAGVLDSTAPRV